MSPPRSNRGAKAAPAKAAKATKSRPSGPRAAGSAGLWDEYHTLLAVSLGAILIGAIMLALVLKKYDFDTAAKGGAASLIPSVTKTLA